MSRVALVLVASSFLVACGPSLKAPTITLGNEARLFSREGRWFMSAPVEVRLHEATAQVQLTASVKEKSVTGFIQETIGPVDPQRGVFEFQLRTTGEPRRQVPLRVDLTVAAHVWDGAYEVETGTATSTYTFSF